MKKIIILIVTCFFLTGCYDYKEINNLAFISAIGIDYQNEEYVVTLEVLNQTGDKDSMQISTYTVDGKSSSLAKAIQNASNKISKQANYTHVKLMILSESIANDKLKNIIDFFLRSTYFRENFYVVSSLDNSPLEILKNIDEKNPVASTAIIDLLENNNYSSNSAVIKNFDKIAEEIITIGIDTSFSNITLNDEKNFEIDGLLIYDDYKLANVLDNEKATIYNILLDNFFRPIFAKKYDDKEFSVAIATGNPKVEMTEDKIKISGRITGKIMNNEPDFDIKSLDTLDKINKDFSKILNDKITKFMEEIQKSHSDILAISEHFYEKTRQKDTKRWQYLKVESNIEFSINKRGLIYEVPNEK